MALKICGVLFRSVNSTEVPHSAIFIFSIVLDAEYLSYVKSIETHLRAFLLLNTSAVGSVKGIKFIQVLIYDPNVPCFFLETLYCSPLW